MSHFAPAAETEANSNPVFRFALSATLLLSVLLIVAFASGENARLSALLLVCATITLAAPIVTVSLNGRFDVFHPLCFVALSLFFGVFGRTFYIIYGDHLKVSELMDGQPLEFLVPGAVLSAIGALLISVGYSFGFWCRFRASGISTFLRGTNLKRLILALPIIFAVCVVANYFFLKTTGFEYTGLDSISAKRRVVINDVESSMGYYRLVAQDIPRVILLMLVAAYCSVRRSSKLLLLFTVAFGLLAITLPFLSSSRGNVLIALISVCVVVQRSRGLSIPLLAGSIAIAVFIIFGMLALRRVNTRSLSIGESVQEMGLEPLFGNHSFADIVKLSAIYESVPSLIDYKYGSSFATILYAPIPRAIWKDKPAVAMGREITEKIYNKGLDMKDKGGGRLRGFLRRASLTSVSMAFQLPFS